MGEYNITGLAIPLFLIFIAVEYLFLRLRGRSLYRYYVGVAFAVLLGLAAAFLYCSPVLAASHKLLGVAVIIGGVIALNGLLEGRRHYWLAELARWPLAVWLGIVVFYQIA